MNGIVVLDTNLLVLLAVGIASKDYIAEHKRTSDQFDVAAYDMLCMLLAEFSEIVVVAHVVAETSNLVRQISNPKRQQIHDVLGRFVSSIYEWPITSAVGFQQEEAADLGITDAVMLHLCSLFVEEARPTLLTADRPLADRAHSLGYSVIDFGEFYQP